VGVPTRGVPTSDLGLRFCAVTRAAPTLLSASGLSCPAIRPDHFRAYLRPDQSPDQNGEKKLSSENFACSERTRGLATESMRFLFFAPLLVGWGHLLLRGSFGVRFENGSPFILRD
jgi:hypothetical protein